MSTPFVDHVGARFLEVQPGSSLMSLDLQPQHLNSSQVMHGGVLFTLADTGMGAALFATLEPTQTCVTIEIKINYFRPVRQGPLLCRSQLVHRGRRTAALEATLSVGDAVVGKASGAFAILERG